MDVDTTESTMAQKLRSKLKRKRSNEQLMLRHSLKRTMLTKDLIYSPPTTEKMWPPNAFDVNMNISVSLK